MKLDTNGLPQPGRELDAWIAEHVPELGYKWRIHPANGKRLLLAPGLREHWKLASGKEKLHPGWRLEVQGFSTTHAFFQVMEAKKEWRFEFVEWAEHLTVMLRGATTMFAKDWPCMGRVHVAWADYPDREHAYAHAVCAVTWMAIEGGE
jgi:hypothetical protein